MKSRRAGMEHLKLLGGDKISSWSALVDVGAGDGLLGKPEARKVKIIWIGDTNGRGKTNCDLSAAEGYRNVQTDIPRGRVPMAVRKLAGKTTICGAQFTAETVFIDSISIFTLVEQL
jgi:hypothetical protein